MGLFMAKFPSLYRTSRIWSYPPTGENKLNSDASVRPGSGFIGVGAIIRNDTGSVIATLSKPIYDDFSMEACELLALREGLLLANMHNLVMNCVEVNAANIASDVGVISCQHILQSGNMVAHTLSALALSSTKDCVWLDDKPDSVASLL
ncbi:hypothetical protein ACOSP7_014449 [Xanthoceras sorbifolium]